MNCCNKSPLQSGFCPATWRIDAASIVDNRPMEIELFGIDLAITSASGKTGCSLGEG